MDKIVLRIPKKSEYMSTIRLTTSALANVKGFNVDEIEDIKVIIAEICTFFIKNIKNNSEDFEIIYQIHDNKVKIKVTDLNECKIPENVDLESDMSIMIIESLADYHKLDLVNKTLEFEKIKFSGR